MKLKNIIIIGASQGIGEALVREYASKGAVVVMLSRNVEAMKQIADEIKRTGGKAYYHRCDVTDRAQIRDGIMYAKKTLSQFDLVLYNSGIGEPGWIQNFDSGRLEAVMAVNLFGLAYTIEVVTPIMIKQGKGIIAGISSLADVRGYPGSASYGISKTAATHFLESARVELRGKGIRVITIRPGWVQTAINAKNDFPMPFTVSPQYAAKKIRRGIARRRSTIQFPFPVVLASRFAHMLPNFLFDRLIPRLRKIP